MPPLLTLPRVDSTNSHAFRELEAGRAGHLCAWRAEAQDAGRGRRGAKWVGAPGDTLMMSVVVRGDWPWAGALSLVAALAVLDAVLAVAGGERVPLAVDWPNDVVQAGESANHAAPEAANQTAPEAPKLAGILIEGRHIAARPASDAGMHFVVGIGINVRGTLDATLRAERPVVTLAELGIHTTTEALGRALHAALAARVHAAEQHAAMHAFGAFALELCTEYLAASGLANRPVTVGLSDGAANGVLRALEPSGLTLEHAGAIRRFPLEHVQAIHRTRLY